MTIFDGVGPYALTSFVTLLVVIDPFALVPTIFAMLSDRDAGTRQAIMTRSLRIAFGIAIFFLIAGRFLLMGLGVSLNAFSISGGVLLFLVALPMLFGNRGGLMSAGEQENPAADSDLAVFPIAIPLISGPGTLTTVLVLSAAAKGSMVKEAVLVATLALVFLITAVVLRSGAGLMAKLGESGVHVVTRVLGIILAALAAQFVLSGIAGFVGGLK